MKVENILFTAGFVWYLIFLIYNAIELNWELLLTLDISFVIIIILIITIGDKNEKNK